MDAAGHQADIAKTIENHRFSMVLVSWRVILEVWRSSGSSRWHAGWQLAGWLMGWLVVACAGWEAGWPQGTPRSRGTPVGRGLTVCVGGPRSSHLSRNLATIHQWTRD